MTKTPYQAPNFELKSSDAETVSLADFAGSWLVVYFYPKDDTPGCTTQACGVRDARDELTDMGVEVVGVSRDDAASHEKFKTKYNLNFTLLSDPNHQVMEAYGAWGPTMFGKSGVQRKTFIIDPGGQVVKIYGRVTPLGHGQKLVEDVKQLQANS